MNKQQLAISLISNICEKSDFKDLCCDLNEIQQKILVSNQEFVVKIIEFSNKYPFEMEIVNKKNFVCASVNSLNKSKLSNKDCLLNILITIAVIKILKLNDVTYDIVSLNDYDYLLNLLKYV